LLEKGRFHCRVGEDVSQHRRHVGRDHTAALDDRAERDSAIIDHSGGDSTFRESIGRGDGHRGVFPRARLRRQRQGDAFARLVLGQRHTDHAGRGYENLLPGAAKMGRHLIRELTAPELLGCRAGSMDDGVASNHPGCRNGCASYSITPFARTASYPFLHGKLSSSSPSAPRSVTLSRSALASGGSPRGALPQRPKRALPVFRRA